MDTDSIVTILPCYSMATKSNSEYDQWTGLTGRIVHVSRDGMDFDVECPDGTLAMGINRGRCRFHTPR